VAELTVSAGLARGLIDVAAARGADRAELIACAGIDPADLDDQDRRVPLARYVALMRAGKALSGDPALALHYGSTVDMAAFSVVGLIFQTCESILDAIAQINRYGQLVVEVDLGEGERFQWRRAMGGFWIVDTRRNANGFPELTEATFARFVGMTRQFWETPLVQEVHVTHAAPAHAAEYARVFEAPVRFDADWNAMRLDEPRLTDPIARQPRYAFGILSEHAEALLRRLESLDSARAEVERRLMPVLHRGEASIGRIAAEMGVSRQTLYRRLKAEGVTFEQLLDALRHRLALDYLRGRRVSVNETAYLLGFSDPAAFSRAFKRWEGRSPREARAEARRE
jgi:AraC-like DNA-binding protein